MFGQVSVSTTTTRISSVLQLLEDLDVRLLLYYDNTASRFDCIVIWPVMVVNHPSGISLSQPQKMALARSTFDPVPRFAVISSLIHRCNQVLQVEKVLPPSCPPSWWLTLYLVTTRKTKMISCLITPCGLCTMHCALQCQRSAQKFCSTRSSTVPTGTANVQYYY